MPEHTVGLQIAPTPQGPQQQQTQQQIQPPRRPTATPSISEFIVEDLRLFSSPVKVVVDELLRQLKR
jgi:hypothetical protein